MAEAPKLDKFTMAEVEKHASDDDTWIVIDGKVYDVTKFMDSHPGGPELITDNAGMDATDEFEDVGHSLGARKQLQDYLIGELDQPAAPARAPSSASSISTQAGGLNPVYVVAAGAVLFAVYYFAF